MRIVFVERWRMKLVSVDAEVREFSTSIKHAIAASEHHDAYVAAARNRQLADLA
jgi:hypothetical protein